MRQPAQAKRAPQMKWLRLYHEARTDAKLESLPDDEFRVWFRLLCFANEQPARGVIANFSTRLLAVEVARGDVALLQRALTSFAELRIVETSDDAHTFIHWNARQFESDNVTKRVLKHRGQLDEQSETLQKRFSNGHVTLPDTDTDTEDVSPKEEDSSVSFGADAHSQTSADALSTAKPRKPAKVTPIADAEPRPRNEWWDALVDVFGYEPRTKPERSKWGKVVSDLKAAQATGADIRRAKANYDAGVASGAINWTLYPTSLSSHLGELLKSPRASPHHNGHRPVTAATASRPILTADDVYPD
jgi:hypothetical protein